MTKYLFPDDIEKKSTCDFCHEDEADGTIWIEDHWAKSICGMCVKILQRDLAELACEVPKVDLGKCPDCGQPFGYYGTNEVICGESYCRFNFGHNIDRR